MSEPHRTNESLETFFMTIPPEKRNDKGHVLKTCSWHGKEIFEL
jgi:hypothetical protein